MILLRLFLVTITLGIASGCATTSTKVVEANPADPYETVNRKVFAFNTFVDTMFLRPIAKAYVAVTPSPVKKGVSNFFGNIGDATSLVNDALQGKPDKISGDLSRVFVNTFFGFGGLYDIGTDLGYEKGEEDYGQTLGHYGMRSGPYVVLPFFGPSSIRDTIGMAPNFALNPVSKLTSSVTAKNTLTALGIVDARAGLFPTEALLQSASLDKYTFLRSAYLQRRQSLVFDGRPPKED